MEVCQHLWQNGQFTPELTAESPDLILLFGNEAAREALPLLQQRYPDRVISGCSTSGEIAQQTVMDESAAISLINFSATKVRSFSSVVENIEDSFYQAQSLARQAAAHDLQHLLIFADGLCINANEVVSGATTALAPFNNISGGVAGDGDRFEKTYTYDQQGAHSNRILMLGFYGDKLQASCGCYGGWDAFGPMRRVTRSEGNRLYELDGQSALELYKRYLGDYAKDLPASGLRFPLHLRRDENDPNPVVCSVLGTDEEDGCIIFGADLPENYLVQLMRANLDRLIDGAHTASEQACRDAEQYQPQFALMISCVGRRAVLQQLVDEELETLEDTLSQKIPHTGFYSYGEIAPNMGVGPCNLHNQTMTITTFAEQE